MELLKRLDEVGYERTRRALAALALSLFMTLYLLVSFQAPEGWAAAFLALAVCYGVAFMGVAAEWFWGRWFASGLGWSGVMVGIASLIMIGWSPPLAIYGGLHALVVLALAGKKMADRYDLQEAWRTRYGMDEFGVARLRKTVTRAAASLPSLILWALGPKEPGQGLWLAFAGVVATSFAVVGLRGVVRMRSWGLMAMAASSAMLVALGLAGVQGLSWAQGPYVNLFAAGPLFSATLLGAAVLPFLGPALRFVARRRA
jgi:hypothetical protein